MTNHTADDFANAKFAEHPDGRIAAKLYEDIDALDWFDSNEYAHTDAALAHAGWVPVPTKPTITESQFAELSKDLKNRTTILACALERAGIAIAPDPEPTNKERLAQLIGGGIKANKQYADGLAEYLDDMGVTAPNVKGN